ncbi:MAG: AAA family ATPase [bacterium]|nr:AAA family ATPase [bacterium]
MQLDTLIIGSPKGRPAHHFKNLEDLALDFGSGRGVTALVGESGTGKSSILEALAVIFRDLMRGSPEPAFAYRLAYRMGVGPRGHLVRIDADPDRDNPYRITACDAPAAQDEPADPAGGAPLTLAEVLAASATLLPRRVIGYSPGASSQSGEMRGHESDGERQKRAVLDALRQAADGESLILLDGPDSHLHPQDRRILAAKLTAFAGAGGTVRAPGHIVVATHEPITVGGLRREQVRILRREGQRTVVDMPDEHPQGMGVTGLLKSELFGLSSTLDIETERRLLRRNALFVKQPRSPEEGAELARLSAELADLGFSSADFRDPMYALFARKMAERRQFCQPALTPEQRAEQDRIASEIIDEVLREGAASM